MIKYIIYLLIISLIGMYIFIKVKFKFWASQPVFHIYNLKHWLLPCGIIQHNKPHVTKFYNKYICTHKYDDLSTEKKALLCSLIQGNYLYNKKEKYTPTNNQILEYFNNHNESSYISLYYEHFYEYDRENKTHNYPKKLICCMTTRPLNLIIDNKKISIGYVDFLCTHKKYRKKGIAPITIYSHYKNVRDLDSHDVYLFKREGTINFIVPLTIYYSYAFSSKKWKQINTLIPNNISSILIKEETFELLVNFFPDILSGFSCSISPELSHIKNQIIKNLLIPVIIFDNNIPVGCYFFRNPSTNYKNKVSIECIGSYYKKDYKEIFIDSFSNAIFLVNSKIPFDIFLIENLSNNNFLLKAILKRDTMIFKTPMAYYFYNFVYTPFISTNVFILN